MSADEKHLIGNLTLEDFQRIQLDNGILHVRSAEIASPLLVNIDELEHMITYNRIIVNNLSMSRDEHPISRELYSDGTFIDPNRVATEIAKGGSIIIRGADHYFPKIRSIVKRFSEIWGCEGQGNIYISTPGVSATYPHFDPHELFIFQLSGSKRWRLFEGDYRFPEMDDGFDAGRHPIGAELDPVVLHEGDVLFLTRGRIHQPVALEHSIHLALGLKGKSVAQVLIQLVAGLARTEEVLRMPIDNPRAVDALKAKLHQALAVIDNYVQNDLIALKLYQSAIEPSNRSGPAEGWLRSAILETVR